MKPINVLIIDDEHLAREIIRGFLSHDDQVKILGECENGFEGFKQINELKPDLVFLDVMMPKLTGFEMLELLENPPLIVFSTAYDEYAIKAFEQNAIDYLLKPYDQARFEEALKKAKTKLDLLPENQQKVNRFLAEQTEKVETLTRVAVRTGAKIHIIPVEKLKYIEAQDDYVKLHSTDGSFLKQQTMKYYESHLPHNNFVRIHRSFIVRLKDINKVEPMGKDTHVVILHDNTELAVSRTGYSRLKEVLNF